MAARDIGVDVRAEDGSARRVTRKLYGTRFGPVIDLGAHDQAFGWSQARALAIRDINADNFRIFRNFFFWNQAKSLDDFIAIQRREVAMPWVNTVAIGRGDGRVWYGDIGAVPNVADALRQACAAPLSKPFATIDALTPLLDGSRSACDWPTDAAAAQPGAMPAAALPRLLREDYVANMNDSHWLANPQQPLEGYASLLGGERRALSLRARLGHRMAQEMLRAESGSAQVLGRRLMDASLAPRVHSAELFKHELLAQACVPGHADVARACDILRRWPNRADADDRGALLWEAFWSRLLDVPLRALYRVPFSHEAPLDTPRAPVSDDQRVAQALAAAVQDLATQGRALDEAVGARRYAMSGGRRLPLYGGCHSAGYFVIACDPSGGERIGPDALANSYLQVVRFGPRGVEAHTLLAHGQDEDAVDNGREAAPVERYARKAWLHFPFREDQIARDPGLRRTLLAP
jgi:acyl-homoserine-lactone acylase